MNANKCLLASALVLLPVPIAFAEIHVFSAIPLISTEEVPEISTDGHGVFTGMYDDESNVFYYSFAWNLDSPANNAHFHGPAARGESAGVLIDLGPVSGNVGEKRGSVTLMESQEEQLLDGLWYINVHSTMVPAGEIRGQMVELPPAETPAVYDTSANVLTLNSVIVPGLGVFEVELTRIEGRDPLAVEVRTIQRKDLDEAAMSP